MCPDSCWDSGRRFHPNKKPLKDLSKVLISVHPSSRTATLKKTERYKKPSVFVSLKGRGRQNVPSSITFAFNSPFESLLDLHGCGKIQIPQLLRRHCNLSTGLLWTIPDKAHITGRMLSTQGPNLVPLHPAHCCWSLTSFVRLWS